MPTVPQFPSSGYVDDGSDYIGTKVLELSEDGLLFELNTDGERTPPQSVTVTNTGTGRVIIRKVLITAGVLDFTLVDANGYPEYLDPGEDFTIIADFTARVDGIAVGIIEIYTDEWNKLPYTIVLSSRTARLPMFDDLYQDLFIRIQQEATARLAGDNTTTSTLTALINAEAATRQTNDNTEIGLRQTLDTTLRALIASSVAAEAAIRLAADNALGSRLTLVEQAQSDDTVFGVDLEARTLISIETSERITADGQEATLRLQLESSFNTALSNATASINTQLTTLANAQGALASQVTTIAANYVTSGQVTSIASALVQTEAIARAAGDAAEASARLLLAATLRTETTNAVGAEATIRSAAILSEQSLRITGDSVNANSILSLHSQLTNARGLAPNGTFQGGAAGWSGGMNFVVGAGGKITPTSPPGAYAVLISAVPIVIDPTRAYLVNCTFKVNVAPCVVYVGVRCYNSTGTYLGNIYDDVAGGEPLMGLQTVSNVMTGEETYPIPTARVGNKFPTGTTKVELCALCNYPDPASVPGSYVQIENLFLDDFTNASVVDARVTQEVNTLVTDQEATATALETLTASFTTAQGNIATLQGGQAANAAAIISANAAILTEQTARANAVLAEATRVNTLLASYTTTTGMNNAITTAVNAEVTNRNSAIASAVAAEASARTTMIASYSTTGAMNSAITAAVSAEASARATAVNAVASNVTSLSTTVGGHTTTISNHTTSINGILGKYGVTIDVNGYVSGFQLNSGGTTSEFIINADNFEIRKPGGGAKTEYSDGNWRIYDSGGTLRVRLGIW